MNELGIKEESVKEGGEGKKLITGEVR